MGETADYVHPFLHLKVQGQLHYRHHLAVFPAIVTANISANFGRFGRLNKRVIPATMPPKLRQSGCV
jgi:hypothetical protein